MLSRTACAGWAVLYGLLVFYASVVVSPLGFAPKPLTLDAAVEIFRHVRYVRLGSDQQADWMANLLMLVPLGFLAAVACMPRFGGTAKLAAGVGAFVLCAMVVVGVKFAQVFFPRTVTINYIVAQLIGAMAGVGLGLAGRDRVESAWRRLGRRRPESLGVLLAAATLGVIGFMLVPFDFVLSAADFAERRAALPGLLFQLPGADRSLAVRGALVAIGVVAVAPIGMLLALLQPRRGLGGIAVQAVLAMGLVTVAAMAVMGATPALINIPIRAFGIVVGAKALRWLQLHDVGRLRRLLSLLALATAPLYLMALAVVNGLVTTHWRSLAEAVAAVDHRFYIPLWTDYIVTKAQAVRSVFAELTMYAPVGLLFWARGWTGRRAAWLAAVLAFCLSAAVELGRWLKPGLALDINNPAIAAVAAGLTVSVTPFLWDVLRSLHLSPAGPGAGLDRPRKIRLAGGIVVCLACFAAIGVVLMRYPPAPEPLAVAVAVYCGALVWRPSAWLVLLPAIIPAVQLAPWTGWMLVTESDLFVLATIAVLVLRAPPSRVDMMIGRVAGFVVLAFLLSTVGGVVLSFLLAEPGTGSSNVYMQHANALRLAKPVLVAVLLMPFAAGRQRLRGDAVTLFCFGMTLGVCAVGGLAMVERMAFTGLFDFSTDYRIVGPFASMHIGGGHIGAYFAMALPFVAVWVIRPRLWTLPVLLVSGVVGGYALVVTFARTAYAAAVLALVTTAMGLAIAATGRSRVGILIGMMLLLGLVGGGLGVAALSGSYMAGRFATIGEDLATREGNWTGGPALQSADVVHRLFGMGIGSYPRLSLAASGPMVGPTDFQIRREEGRSFMVLRSREELYLGQKVALVPGQPAILSIEGRSAGGSGLDVAVCEKLLLYSTDCAGAHFALTPAWTRQQATITVPVGSDLPRSAWVSRPVDMSFFSAPGTEVAFTDVRLIDAKGVELVANGGFGQDMDRWFFTADNHLAWRIKDQYLMTVFEQGVIGLLCLAALFAVSVLSAVRALRRGQAGAACIVGSLAAVCVSFLFDALLESPGLATAIYLVLGMGIVSGRRPA